ncbi:hypothetical protein ACB098_04G002600 [Castanea mollissima]
MAKDYLFLCLVVLQVMPHAFVNGARYLKSDRLCSQCSKCDTSECPPSEAYPHITAFDDTLIAGALQSDYVGLNDRKLHNIIDWQMLKLSILLQISYKQTCHDNECDIWFGNYMDKCSGGQSYLTVDMQGKVSLRLLNSLESLAEADWKSINPPTKFNHHAFGFWLSCSTGQCLTVFGGKTSKRTVGVAECKMDGSNPYQLFAFRFHYHKAFCCCGLHNE